MIIRLEQVLDAIETADDAFTYFFDTQTGETVFLSDPMITGESYEELEELIESSGNRFLRFPTKYDIHECSIMENFVYSLPAGAARQELANAICGRGAFRCFKNGNASLAFFSEEKTPINFTSSCVPQSSVKSWVCHKRKTSNSNVSISNLRSYFIFIQRIAQGYEQINNR